MDKSAKHNEREFVTPAEFLKAYRQRLGLTQDELAQRLGCSRGYLARIETGLDNFSHALIAAIKHDLGAFVDLSMLLNIKHRKSLQDSAQNAEETRLKRAAR